MSRPTAKAIRLVQISEHKSITGLCCAKAIDGSCRKEVERDLRYETQTKIDFTCNWLLSSALLMLQTFLFSKALASDWQTFVVCWWTWRTLGARARENMEMNRLSSWKDFPTVDIKIRSAQHFHLWELISLSGAHSVAVGCSWMKAARDVKATQRGFKHLSRDCLIPARLPSKCD